MDVGIVKLSIGRTGGRQSMEPPSVSVVCHVCDTYRRECDKAHLTVDQKPIQEQASAMQCQLWDMVQE